VSISAEFLLVSGVSMHSVRSLCPVELLFVSGDVSCLGDIRRMDTFTAKIIILKEF